MAFEIEFDPDAVKDLKKLDRPVQQRLVGFLRTRVATLDNPRDIGEALSGAKLGKFWKYRVGDWRIICESRIVALLSGCCGSETAARFIGEAGVQACCVAEVQADEIAEVFAAATDVAVRRESLTTQE